jgi:ribosomal protein L11 methyltransferase
MRARVWREDHHGVMIGGRLWVGPPSEQPRDGALAVVIEQGHAFGSGAHATTTGCLELLCDLADTGSVLDLGCGSGVLSIAAAKLGFAPVLGIDLDDAAVEATAANATVNGVGVQAKRVDALQDELPATDVVLANVALDVVERILPRLRAPLAVTSGYLDRDRPSVGGWEHVDRREADGWAADLLSFSA